MVRHRNYYLALWPICLALVVLSCARQSRFELFDSIVTEELIRQGSSSAQAEAEVSKSIDRLIYYAGWADKFQQIFSAVNPVASSHFNFSVLVYILHLLNSIICLV